LKPQQTLIVTVLDPHKTLQINTSNGDDITNSSNGVIAPATSTRTRVAATESLQMQPINNSASMMCCLDLHCHSSVAVNASITLVGGLTMILLLMMLVGMWLMQMGMWLNVIENVP